MPPDLYAIIFSGTVQKLSGGRSAPLRRARLDDTVGLHLGLFMLSSPPQLLPGPANMGPTIVHDIRWRQQQ